MRQVQCPACKSTLEISENSRFCRVCGKPLNQAELVASGPTNLAWQTEAGPKVEQPEPFQMPSFVLEPDITENTSEPPTKPLEIAPTITMPKSYPSIVAENKPSAGTDDFYNKSTEKFGKTEVSELTTELPRTSLEPLPFGHMLMDRYRVIEFLVGLSIPGSNWYRLEDKEYYTHCAYCNYSENQPDDVFCADCGTALERQKYFLSREALSLGKPTGEAVLMSTNIPKSEGLINPYINFLEGERAYSLKLENKDERPLTSYQGLPLELRLRWTGQLIGLMVDLHAKNLVGCNVGVEALNVLPGDRLLVSHVYNCHPAAETGEFQADLATLVSSLEFILNHRLDHEVSENPRQAKTEANWRQALCQAIHFEDALALQDLWQSVQAAPPLPPLRNLRSARGWHTGQIRTNNEDAVFSLDLALQSDLGGEPAGLYIVADGMGGHEMGEVASSMAIQVITEALALNLLAVRPAEYDPDLVELQQDMLAKTIGEAVEKANQQIFQNGQGKMGTTLTCALVQHSMAFIANIGDSRTYHWHENQLNQMTTDDSKVFKLVENGELNREDIYTHPERNVLLRSLGEPKSHQITVVRQVIRPGDRLLLCSDGLWEMVHDPELGAIIGTSANLEDISHKLVEAANRNGGEDNIGLVVVEAT